MDRMPAAEMTPGTECWLHPAVEVRRSPIDGHGLFATARLPEGTVVIRLGGTLVSNAELGELIAATEADNTAPYVDSVSVGRDSNLRIAPGELVHYGNHSCDPNLWHVDAFTLTARRVVVVGEELTVDYATQTHDAAFVVDCLCGSQPCRERVTGDDWKLPALRERYGQHWVPVLLDRHQVSSPVRVVAGLLRRDGRLLLCHRHPDRTNYPDVWDLPGGHIDSDESMADALVRELEEELGIQIGPPDGPPWVMFRDGAVELSVFLIDRWLGEPRNVATDEHDSIGWFGVDDLTHIHLAHPSYLELLRHAQP